MAEIMLQAHALKKHFPVTKGFVFSKSVGSVKAVDGVEFAIRQGETFGLVGESGCGKTTTTKLLLLLEHATSGSVVFEGQDIFGLRGEKLKAYRRSVQAVFQDPFSSLNPRKRVSHIVGEPVETTCSMPRDQIRDRVAECLEQVGLRASDASLFPHEFSGGQRQRIAVARALAPRPRLIILDEPVSALDVSIRAGIMNLLRKLQERSGVTYIVIAHDLAAVRYMSKRTGVMYLGKLVETGQSDDLFTEPLHPYTMALLSAALPSHPDHPRTDIILSGEVPSPLNPPQGCRFHPRCFKVMPVCSEVEPSLKDVGGDRTVSCHLYQ